MAKPNRTTLVNNIESTTGKLFVPRGRIYNDDGTLKYDMTEMKIDFLVKEIFDWCKTFIDGWYGTDWEITYNSGLDAFNKIDSRSEVAWIEILDYLYRDGYSDKEIEVAINRIEGYEV